MQTHRAVMAQETGTADAAWPALIQTFQVFLLGSSDHPEQSAAAASNTHDSLTPTSPTAAKQHLSNGPSAPDHHHLISLDSRNSSHKAAALPNTAPRPETSEADSEEAMQESISQVDAELEAAVLDTLTENVLVSCANIPSDLRSRSSRKSWRAHMTVLCIDFNGRLCMQEDGTCASSMLQAQT